MYGTACPGKFGLVSLNDFYRNQAIIKKFQLLYQQVNRNNSLIQHITYSHDTLNVDTPYVNYIHIEEQLLFITPSSPWMTGEELQESDDLKLYGKQYRVTLSSYISGGLNPLNTLIHCSDCLFSCFWLNIILLYLLFKNNSIFHTSFNFTLTT